MDNMGTTVRIIKEFIWSLKDETSRFNYIYGLYALIPGPLGFSLRNRLVPKYCRQCGDSLVVQGHVRFLNLHKITIGRDVVIANGSFLQGAGGITLADNVLLGPDVKIWSTNHRFDDIEIPILAQGYDDKPIMIGEGVWLGSNVIVLPGVTIPKGCVVGAGSVVGIKKYPEYAILVGNPCRVVGNRLKSS